MTKREKIRRLATTTAEEKRDMIQTITVALAKLPYWTVRGIRDDVVAKARQQSQRLRRSR